MFVSHVKAKGNYYFYLYSYIPEKLDNKPIYGLGKREMALNKLELWKKDFNNIPSELRVRGIEKEDLSKWINKLKLA